MPYFLSDVDSVHRTIAFLGFRRGPDTWSARYRTRDGKQTHKFLSGPPELDEAKRQAEAWLAQLAGSAVRSIKRGTVREALEAHLADLRRHGHPDTAPQVEGRFGMVVYEDAVAEAHRLIEAGTLVGKFVVTVGAQ